MGAYGTGVYGVGVYGVGEDDPTPPTPPPVARHVTTARLGDSGIVLSGGPDEYGVEWSWQKGADPWSPGPTPREVSGPRGSAHGSWSATRYVDSRRQELSVLVTAPSHEAMHQAKQRWMSAIAIEPFEFVVDEPFFGERFARMRRVSVGWTEDVPWAARAVASLTADDPLIYGLVTRTVSTGSPSSTGGLSWPATWPAIWDATVTTGLLRLVNAGDQRTPVAWRIDGPMVNPMVTEVATGRRFQLDMELADGEWITVDTATGRVLAQGDVQASRRARFRGQWLDLPPGEHEFAFGGGEAGVNARLMASTRDAWI